MAISETDVIIIGAGAAGLMCAIEAGKRGRKVMLLDHASKIGEKIRISGGGRCNFTNINAEPKNYISNNPHFCKSALARYTPSDFLELIKTHKIEYYEKTLGQLFCRESATQIIDMLISECNRANVKIELNTEVKAINNSDDGFIVELDNKSIKTTSLVVACGGKSIPKIGATGFGYEIAKQFGLNIIEPRPGLVPLTFDQHMKEDFSKLAGLSLDVDVKCNGTSFREALLFTHRGLSGPAILQISSYWREGVDISINLLPKVDISQQLKNARAEGNKSSLSNFLSQFLPKKLAQFICQHQQIPNKAFAQLSDNEINIITQNLCNWTLTPQGSEGYRTAEVTIGGVDTDELSSKTFEAKKIGGLFFIGEVVDVTGHLGGYNFQWAWASGYTAGQYV